MGAALQGAVARLGGSVRGAQTGRQEAWPGPRSPSPLPPQHRECP